MNNKDDQKEINEENEMVERRDEPKKISRAEAMKRIGLLAFGTFITGASISCGDSLSGGYSSNYYSHYSSYSSTFRYYSYF